MPTTTTISAITNQAELQRYNDEYSALEDEHQNLSTIEQGGVQAEHQRNAHEYGDELTTEMTAIDNRRIQYNKAKIAKATPRQKAEDAVGAVANTSVGLGWSVLLGVGIILKETVQVAAPVLTVFLFPLHFALEGLRSIWEFYQTARDSAAAHRKTLLGSNIVHIMALIAAATVTALAITNPFALPVIFLGLTGAGLYKTVATIMQTRKAIKAAENELIVAQSQSKALKDLNSNDKKVQFMLIRLEAKENRLKEQLTHLQAKRSELRRGLVFNLIAIAAVGLLLAAALFPPAAIALAGVGMLLFASTVIAGVLTSPAVRNAVKRLWKGIKGLFGASDNDAPEPENAAAPSQAFDANENESADETAPLLISQAANDDDAQTVADVTPTTGRAPSFGSVKAGFFQPEPQNPASTAAQQANQAAGTSPQ